MTKPAWPDGSSVDFAELYSQRERARAYAVANGFGEGDPLRNGEFATVRAFGPHVDCFVDVGANNGLFVDEVASAERPPHVIAFEPNPTLAEALARKGATVVQCAVGDKEEQRKFHVHPLDDTISSLTERLDIMPSFAGKMQRIHVKVTTLDAHLDRILTNTRLGVFVKIDVEGHELAVLRGSERLFDALPKAVVMFEYSTGWSLGGHSVRDAFHLLDKHNFMIFRLLPLGLEHLRFYTPDMEHTGYCNYAAVKGLVLDQILTKEDLPSTTHIKNDVFLF